MLDKIFLLSLLHGLFVREGTHPKDQMGHSKISLYETNPNKPLLFSKIFTHSAPWPDGQGGDPPRGPAGTKFKNYLLN